MLTVAFLMLLPDAQGEKAVCPFSHRGQGRETSRALASVAQRILLDSSRRPLGYQVLSTILKGKEIKCKQQCRHFLPYKFAKFIHSLVNLVIIHS